ncbi:MAG: proton-conducting transporter membrane subunit [Acidimicrobiia bacterium]
MSWLLPAAVAVPILGAGLVVAVGRRLLAQRMIAGGSVLFVLGAAIALLVEADRAGPVVAQMGGWPAPGGITLIADRMSALVLMTSALMLVAVFGYAVAQLGRSALDWWFHAKYLVLTSGVALSLLTGDLFNLFVGFEVMLVASYVLLTVRTGPREIRSTLTYVVINLVASILFLLIIALAYGATGTLNLADLAVRLEDVAEPVRAGLSLLMLVVFGIKAGLFPLFMWLPDSYPTAPAPVTAIFAGLLTKVGMVIIIRTQTLLFPSDGPSTLLLVVAGLTMVVGVLGAIAQNDVKRILSFHIVSQIGYMVMGLGFLTVAGIGSAVFFLANQVIVKTGLFLVAGLVEREQGTGALDRSGGLVHSRPVVAALFLPLALSIAGIPPFGGFIPKLGLVQAGIDLGQGVIVGVSLAVSLLTLFSMTKIWSSAFWGEPVATVGRAGRGMVGATAGVVVASLAVALVAGPAADLTLRAAADLVERSGYITAVLGGV